MELTQGSMGLACPAFADCRWRLRHHVLCRPECSAGQLLVLDPNGYEAGEDLTSYLETLPENLYEWLDHGPSDKPFDERTIVLRKLFVKFHRACAT